MNGRVAAIVTGALALCVTGCGYSTGEVYRREVNTVHVEIFESKEFRRGLEFALTEAVKKRLGATTPYRLASREEADTILRGEVLEVRQAAFAPDFRSRLPRDVQMTLAIRVQWKDLRTGEMFFDDDVRLQSVEYLPPAGESEAFAEQKVVDQMAARIIERMYTDW